MPKVILGIRPNLTIEIEGETKDLLFELGFWDNIPHECPFVVDRDGTRCQEPISFNVRTPTPKSGKNAGQTFKYFMLNCAGNPSHECQLSERMAAKGGGFFIREGSRQDGQSNWRLTYHGREDEEEGEQDHQEYAAPSRAKASGKGKVGAPGYLNESQHSELLRVGRGKGYETEAELDGHCHAIYRRPVSELHTNEAVEYRKTLIAI